MINLIRYKGETLTLKQAISAAKTIRDTTTIGKTLRDDNYHLLTVLMQYHYKYKAYGSPVVSISLEIGPTLSSRVFCAHFRDGSFGYFGLRTLTQGEGQRERSKFFSAARNEIAGQVTDFMRKSFQRDYATCGITGELVHRTQANCDHWPTGFNSLVTQWMLANGLNRDQIEVDTRGKSRRFLDKTLAESWQSYHQEHAQLRVTEKKANQAQGNPSEAEQCN
jgi:hypothetical protein